MFAESTWCTVAGSKSGEYEELRERMYTKVLSNGSLLLQNVKEDREGFYLCQAENGIGTGIGKVVQVKVNCKLIISFSYRCETVDRKIMNGRFQRIAVLLQRMVMLNRTAQLICNLVCVFLF